MTIDEPSDRGVIRDSISRDHPIRDVLAAVTLNLPRGARRGSAGFVAWYNGHPDAADETFGLTSERAVAIGNGNVAIDVARMLVLHPDELAGTDVADHALEALGRSQVREVVLLGRRGPAHAAFTNPELRELGELQRADLIVDPDDLQGVSPPEEPTKRRNLETLTGYAARGAEGKSHSVVFRFLRSPVEIVGNQHGTVSGVRVVHNRLDDEGRVIPTQDEELIECGLVLRSIGYRGRPLDGIPFDEDRGVIRNEGGRVCDEHGTACRGEYAVGWIKRGPSGVIGTNKKDAADTVAKLLADAQAGALNAPVVDDAGWIDERLPHLVTWDGWEAIDQYERSTGEPFGRPRVKLVRTEALLAASRAPSRATPA